MKTKGIYFLYRTLQAFGLPLLLLYFLLRSLRDRRYLRSLPQRLGFLPRTFTQTAPGAIWLHAVSVGEVLSAWELIRRLREELPAAPVFVSVSTLAGRAVADEKLASLAAGVFFAPVDTCFAVRRVLRGLRPSLLIVMETEIWPNLFRETSRTGAGLAIVNGRLSDRAAPRYLALAWFFRHVLIWPDVILAQSAPIAELFVRAGASPERVRAAGNLKYDFQPREAPPDSPVRRYLESVRPRPIWMAASTMPPAAPGDPDEDDAVIAAWQQLPASPFLVIAPRRPERFDVVARKLDNAGLRWMRRSELRAEPADVLLLDSIGELSGLFPLADVVLMGGSLAARGGHNILEPAMFARPIVVGPHMENFRAIAAEFRAAGAFLGIASPNELAGAVDRLLRDPGDLGTRALACAQANRGAMDRAVVEIRRLYHARLPRYRPALYLLLWPLARLWEWGGRRKRSRDRARARRLPAAVISVGNITMGGTGKTPIVIYLAGKLRDAGCRAGILTRGHGRHSPEKHVALAPGARVPVTHSGDEPQIFLRSGLAPVGIGPDRYRAGSMLQQRFALEILILDDGFQHLRLARQVDIVLIDALNPFGGGELFPLGRLREPLNALARAHVFVITRSDFAAAVPAIEAELRRRNSAAPVFHSRVVPEGWVEYGSGRRLAQLPVHRVGAFCGLGNPQSFWRTLAALGLETADRVEFADHHSYRPRELRHLAAQLHAAGAEAAVTTEKDMLNLCDDCEELLKPLPLYWLEIRVEIDDEAGFLNALDLATLRNPAT